MTKKGYVILDTNDQYVGYSPPYAGMYIYGGASTTFIDTVQRYHLARGFAQGTLNKWTFDAGSYGSIIDTANNGSGKLRITTSTDHTLTTGCIVSITGLATNSQNAVTRVTVINSTTFDCDDISYSSPDEVGTFNRGSSLIAGVGAAGVYHVCFSASVTSFGNNKKYNWEIIQNVTERDNISITRMIATGTDEGAVGASGLLTIAEGDIITLAVEGLTDTTDLTFINTNVNLHKI